MITHDSKFKFECDHNHGGLGPLVIEAKTLRTAITKARAKHWDIVRVRVTSGVPKDKIARTVRRVFCPGCAWLVGVTRR